MKNRASSLLLLASACIGLAAGGCSLFHHHSPKPARKPKVESGPMEPNPQPMEANPVEPHPLPIEPQSMDQQ